MTFTEPAQQAFLLDRAEPVGNSPGDDLRGRAHVKISNKASERIPVDGTFTGTVTPSGLRIRMKTTTMVVGDVATPIPALALPSRNAVSITNLETAEVLYLADNALVTANRAIGTTAGHEVNPGEAFNVDITPDIVLYGIARPGQTVLIKVTELA